MCLYKVASGSQLVTYVYNTDASVNSTVNGTYQYSCMVSSEPVVSRQVRDFQS